ncbi:MAG TPA: 6-phosphogluconolactonase [Nocardioidaceae bacterium]|nr:6-phosphogluconolactonase [Nocardioidaceae bacterium]
MSAPAVLVHRTADLLASAVAARLLTRLVDLQSTGRVPSVVLAGGTIADRVHQTVADSAAREAVDWQRVALWWGDERYLPADDAERNETQARRSLLDRLALDSTLVHPMPADDGSGDADAAAERYADELRQAAAPEDHGAVPTFDILMLGIGPDGHVASLFPEHPVLYDERSAVGVHGSPKPPPTRVSLTFASLNRSREVWFLASGDAKARAARLALGGAGRMQIPAAGVRGSARTLWLLDAAAASQLPRGLSRIDSP